MPKQRQAGVGISAQPAGARFSVGFFKMMKKKVDANGERQSGFLIDQVEEERAEVDGLSLAEKEMQERLILQQESDMEKSKQMDQMANFRHLVEKRKLLMNQDKLLAVFAKELPHLRKDQIVDKLLDEDESLAATAERIFTRSIEDYLAIQSCCRQKNVARYLLSNKVERLIGLARIKHVRGVQLLVQDELAHGDVVFCFKMLFLLHRLNQHEGKRSEWSSKRQRATAEMESKLLQMRLDGGKKSEKIDRLDKEGILDFFVELYIDQVLKLKKNRLQLLETRQEIKNILKQRLKTNEWISLNSKNRTMETTDLCYKDIQYLAKELQTAVVIHDNVDIYKFKMYGHSQALKRRPSVHFRRYELEIGQDPPANAANYGQRQQPIAASFQYQHVELKSCPIVHDMLVREIGKPTANQFFEKVIKEMPKWFQYFHDIKSIFRIILKADQRRVDIDKVRFLENFADDFHAWQLKPSKQRFTRVVQQCEKLIQIDQHLLHDWSEKFKRTSKSIYTPEQIIKYLNFNSARDDEASRTQMRKQLKQYYPDMTCMQTFVDFQRVKDRTKSQIGINTKCERDVLLYIQGMPFTYASHFLQQIWENLSTKEESLSAYLENWKGLCIPEFLSKRFLISYLMQNIDRQLRQELTEILTESSLAKSLDEMKAQELTEESLQSFTSVPLVLASQNLVSTVQKYKFNDHVETVLSEGVGILSLGVGAASLGKSSLLNDLIMPLESEASHEFFETQDRNVFSNGQVDVFFRTVNEANAKRPIRNNAIFMDVQGQMGDQQLCQEIAQNLCNIVIFQVAPRPQEQQTASYQLEQVKNQIGNLLGENADNVKVLVLVRDAETSGQVMDVAPFDENTIQYKLRSLDGLTKSQRQKELQDFHQFFWQLVDQYEFDDYRFTVESFRQCYVNVRDTVPHYAHWNFSTVDPSQLQDQAAFVCNDWPNKRDYGDVVDFDLGDYQGQVLRGTQSKQGRGRRQLATEVQEGWFFNNIMDGMCKISYRSGTVFYGMWENHQRHGIGIYARGNGEVNFGHFNRSRFTRGVWQFLNGDVYEGQFQGAYCVGHGIMWYPDGSKHSGLWLNDRKHGKGKTTHADGRVTEGDWNNDVLVDNQGHSSANDSADSSAEYAEY